MHFLVDGYHVISYVGVISKGNTQMKIVKLSMSWGMNLYRYSADARGNGIPSVIEHFNKNPDIRRILGRWSRCPNINVAKRIAG